MGTIEVKNFDIPGLEPQEEGRRMSHKSYWVYVLLCENNTLYTGYTHDLEQRYQSHLDGTGGCKYTRSFKPIKIAQSWEIKSGKSEAMKIERYIKKLTRKEKDKLIQHPEMLGVY